MATDDERRRVAARLRRADAERLDRVYGNDPSHAPLTLSLVAEAAGLHYAPYECTAVEVRNRLAYLIDPDTKMAQDSPRRLEEVEASDGIVPQVDRDALMALADELDKNAEVIISAARNARFTGCGPTMEEAKHDAYEWRYVARRIREACGEVG